MPLWQLPVVVTLVAAHIGCVTGKARTYNNVYVFYDEVQAQYTSFMFSTALGWLKPAYTTYVDRGVSVQVWLQVLKRCCYKCYSQRLMAF
jgi:hypothetical protein